MGISLSEITVIIIIALICLKKKHLSETTYQIGKLYKFLIKQIIRVRKNINV